MDTPVKVTLLPATSRPAEARRRRGAPAWAQASALVAVLIATPLVSVLLGALAPGGEAWAHIAATSLPELLRNSVLLALLVGVMVASAGAVTAWLVATCAFRGRAVLEVALLLPLAMPAYVCGYAYVWLLDVAGPVQTAIRDLTGLRWGEYPFPEIRSLPGAALMLAMVLYPYVYLLCRAAFLQQSVCLLEASRTLGHGLPRTFLHVALPMARPALAAGVALVLMETLADFGTVQHFAVRTFTTGIYEAWFGLGERPAASQLAACLMGLVALLLLFERLSRGGRRYHPTTTRSPPLRPVRLSGWKEAAAIAACAMPVILGFVVPAGTLFVLDAGRRRPAGCAAHHPLRREQPEARRHHRRPPAVLIACGARLGTAAAPLAPARGPRTGWRPSATPCRARSSRWARWCPSGWRTTRWTPGCAPPSASPPG
jgi:iron(III) transport system permease protein